MSERDYPFNSVAVDLTFTTRRSAEQFYWDSPGEGFCVGHKVHKCVEGNKRNAYRLERKARRSGCTTISVDEYNVSK